MTKLLAFVKTDRSTVSRHVSPIFVSTFSPEINLISRKDDIFYLVVLLTK